MSSEHIILLGTMSDQLPAVIFDEKKSTLRWTADNKVDKLPNWIIPHPKLTNGVLYNSAMESKLFAATYDPNGSLTIIDEIKQLEENVRPCHMEMTSDGGAAILANYGSGTVSLIPVNADGTFGKQDSSHTFVPPGEYIKGHPQHSQGHAHQIILRGDEVYVPDLGANNVWCLRYQQGKLVQTGVVDGFEASDGPRHAVLHPNGKVIYVLCQTSSQLVSCSLPTDSRPSKILSRQTITPPEDRDKQSKMMGAAIVYLPPLSDSGDGLLLCTNRGSGHPDGDAISLYTVDNDGTLTPAPTPYVRAADTMRGMAADKSGRWICVAGQTDGNIVVYERTGEAEIVEVARLKDVYDVCSPTWL